MAHRSTLAGVSAAQLAVALAGQVVAIRRRRNYDVPFMRGSPDRVRRDSAWFGTAYSAPVYMLAAQAWATTRLLHGPDERARWTLRWLGTAMTPGYLAERWDRLRLRPAGVDRVETPIVVGGLVGAVAMALLGRRPLTGGPQDGVRP